MSMEEYYTTFTSGNTWAITPVPDYCYFPSPYIQYPDYYIDYRWYNPYCESPNKTEQAYRILKQLVSAKVIPEPDGYQKFCDLIEKIKAVL